jgi:uncharacterized short protein YbdD (DUF466 family)
MATRATQEVEFSRRTMRWARARKLILHVWRGLRDWCGDTAYERYLNATQRQRSQDPPLSQEQFYVEQLQRRYSRPNRCC